MRRRNSSNRVAVVVAIVLAVGSLTAPLLLLPSASFAGGDPKVTVTRARYVDIGFVKSTEAGRHFWGWSMVYAGQYGSANYYGLIGIRLNVMPAGERIEANTVTLGGV